MKRTLVTAAAVIIAGVACTTSYEKISDAEVDASQKEAALQVATKLWSRCSTGQHEKLASSEATPEMVDGLGPEKMAAACSSAKSQFGDFSGLDYAETWKPKSGPLRVYRFKGRFSNATTAPEIRVVMDGTKLSGLWIKPWSETLR